MINLTKFIIASLLLGFVYSDSPSVFVPDYNVGCSTDFGSTCDLQCPNGNYVLDSNGCPTCACVTQCPQIKCRANCVDGGYALNENGCQTCKCVSKEKTECSRLICRMFCQYGFKRDENGCEYCACNETPQECPQLNCERSCSNGYRKDYSGCQTCECAEEKQDKSNDKCSPLTCDLDCKYGLQRDESGCNICACNSCPIRQCRMFCMYGFRKSDDGCEMCECDWTPIAEKIQCDQRIACPGTRVCNLKLKFCEAVNPDSVNWFLYDFEIESEIFQDEKFIQTFKNGLIHNIATKYGLQTTQITVSSVEEHGLTSFQIMPYFDENMEIFENKMDQIDIDLNSHEFRTVLPAVTSVIDDDKVNNPSRINLTRWCQKFKNLIRSKFLFFTIVALLIFTGFMFLIGYISIHRRYIRVPNRSESKTAIYDDTSYHLASTDDEHGSTKLSVSIDDSHSSNDKRVLV